jgi:hypothetical protein
MHRPLVERSDGTQLAIGVLNGTAFTSKSLIENELGDFSRL